MTVYSASETNMSIQLIPVEAINDSPYQARFLSVNDLDTKEPEKETLELVNSIAANGLLHPVTVRAAGDKFELIDGHRRVLAHKLLNKEFIDAIVTRMDDKQAQIMGITANLQRKNLNLIELALAYKKMLDTGTFPDKKYLSSALGKDETYVGDVLNTLNMDKRIIDDLVSNNTVKDVRLLRMVRQIDEIDENQESMMQWNLYQQVIEQNMTRQQVANYIKELFFKKKKRVFYNMTIDKKRLKINLNLGAFGNQDPETIIKFVTDNLDKLDTFLSNNKKH
ncbi:MAG: ParB/RepB/Spo0J family partition protein [Bacteroidetes bacterium]|nr:ParB/RepB/Spo0J family partition protein [Bacteroidota bacterium]